MATKYTCDTCRRECKKEDLIEIEVADNATEEVVAVADICDKCRENVIIRIKNVLKGARLVPVPGRTTQPQKPMQGIQPTNASKKRPSPPKTATNIPIAKTRRK